MAVGIAQKNNVYKKITMNPQITNTMPLVAMHFIATLVVAR